MSLCLETYSMLRVEILIDTTCGNKQITITQYRRLNKPSVLRVEILFDTMCGNIYRKPYLVLLQMFEKRKGTICGNGYCNTSYALCVETCFFVF